MDLIYTKTNRDDVGVLKDYTFDLAFGSDENDFELTLDVNNHCCEASCLVYIEGTEYGGIIDKIGIVTKDDKLTYKGRTWHGILVSKIIAPNADAAYLTVSGEANEVIGSLIERIGLSDLFIASEVDSGLTISNYSFDRYVDAYTGFTKMLATVSGKLKFTFKNGKVILSALPIVDYSYYYPKYIGSSVHIDEIFEAIGVPEAYRGNSTKRRIIATTNGIMDYTGTYEQNISLIALAKNGTLKSPNATDEQFDNDQVEMDIEKTYNTTNHLICLGKGELQNRQVVHLYVDGNGNVSEKQTFTGIQEITSVYDYSNVESLDELKKGGIEKLKEYAIKDKVQMDFAAESNVYDIGDIIGANEIVTGIFVTEKITKKIVTINQGVVNIQYKVGEK